jgi:hypothetical protein
MPDQVRQDGSPTFYELVITGSFEYPISRIIGTSIALWVGSDTVSRPIQVHAKRIMCHDYRNAQAIADAFKHALLCL